MSLIGRYLRLNLILLLLLSPPSVFSQEQVYFDLSLEQLVDVKVTSVAKQPQRIAQSPAAVFVLSNEDIRRSGVTSIPEALRMVPGLHVARLDAYRWAISSRGFTDVFSNKLLVLIDGRTVYTPVFSGVFWDVQDTLLEDVERIEVIRGPGASLWGANAVNGVINIITKSSKDTQGPLISAGGGSTERAFAESRYGTKVGEDTYYRVFGRYVDRKGFPWADPVPGDSRSGRADFTLYHSGFRVDSNPSTNDLFTFQGDITQTVEGQAIVFDPVLQPFMGEFPEDTDGYGGNVLGRWSRTFSETSDLQVQTYFDRTDRDDATYEQLTSTYDLDFQHRFEPFSGHNLMWGGGYRHYQDQTGANFELSFDPAESNLDSYTWFVQDDITVIDQLFHFVLGSKFEHHTYTGFESEPNIRAIFTPDQANTFWVAVSKAVRTPSRAERDVSLIVDSIPPNEEQPYPAFLQGNASKDFDSEDLYAYEAGYRTQVTSDLFFDLAVFFNHYDSFRSAEPREPFFATEPMPHAIIPFTAENNNEVDSNGVELVADWRPFNCWRLVGTYTYLAVDLDTSDSQDPGIFTDEDGSSPEHQWMLRSLLDLPYDLQFDSALRFVGSTRVSSDYAELDLRLAWKPLSNLELSIVGQNLLQPSHVEWRDNRFGEGVIEIERGVYAQVVWKM